MTTAKLFSAGQFQILILPKDFTVRSSEVRVRRQGEAVILEPPVPDWSWLDDVIGPVDQDFEEAATEGWKS